MIDPDGEKGVNIKLEGAGHILAAGGEVGVKAGLSTQGGPIFGVDLGITFSAAGGLGAGAVPVRPMAS